MTYNQRYNSSCADKLYNTAGSKKYNSRPNAKTSYNSFDKRPFCYETNFDFASPKKGAHFEGGFKAKFNKLNNSGYSTMASEGDQEPEVMGFKIVQSGKILFDVQSSDSDSSYSPCERQEQLKEGCFASATNFLGPAPQKISLPSFL